MVRIGGAQIPVTDSMHKNVVILKDAIDWAHKNKVDYLLTPEGSLSGYLNSYDVLEKSNIIELLNQVVAYASNKQVGLALGTEYIREEKFGKVKGSQIRYYDDTGDFINAYNKQMTIPAELSLPGDGPKITKFDSITQNGRHKFSAGSFICNDIWGQLSDTQCIIRDLFYYQNSDTNILFHASNGFRGDEAGTPDDNINLRKFSDMHLWMASRYMMPIVTVDNCYKMNGDFYDGETSSTSGIILNGEWLVKAAPTGIDYFYHDFNF
jgi:predicted amidohydrolase|tara:strand:- start:54 stop:851 length:798 start_codon:yes stop_codon:yes gene_type:complete